jgi:hypothetical protein
MVCCAGVVLEVGAAVLSQPSLSFCFPLTFLVRLASCSNNNCNEERARKKKEKAKKEKNTQGIR